MIKGRNRLYFEVMRIIACYFVLFNHTGYNGFFLYAEYEVGSLPFWLYMFLSIFCKFSVYLFLMISGALLLPKVDESISVVWKKRVLKMGGILLIFNVIYYIYNISVGTPSLDIKNFIRKIYSSEQNTVLWYLYTFLSFLILLPILRVLAKNMSNKLFGYLIVVHFALAVLPMLEYLEYQGTCNLNPAFSFWTNTNIVFFPLLGYFIEERINIKKISIKKVLILWGINIGCIIATQLVTYYKIVYTGVCSKGDSSTFYVCLVAVNCVAIYVLIKYIFVNKIHLSPIGEKIIRVIGRNTFGIYLIHNLIFYDPKIKNILVVLKDSRMNHMCAVLLYCFIVFCLACAVTQLYYLITSLINRIWIQMSKKEV